MAERTSMRVIVLANQKGGVGKTTTAINLGTALAAIGEKVLIVDLDPQGNASTGLGIERRNRTISTYHVLRGEAGLADVTRSTVVPRLYVAPSTLDLLGVELEIASEPDRNFRMKGAIDVLAVDPNLKSDPFTYVLIDCPPSLNLLTINALVASNSVLVPLQCEFFALEGLSQLLTTIEHVKRTLNPSLTIHGVVLTMYDPRNNLATQVAADVRQFMGDQVYDTIIPRNVRVSEAPGFKQTVMTYDPLSPGAIAYMSVARELAERGKPFDSNVVSINYKREGEIA